MCSSTLATAIPPSCSHAVLAWNSARSPGLSDCGLAPPANWLRTGRLAWRWSAVLGAGGASSTGGLPARTAKLPWASMREGPAVRFGAQGSYALPRQSWRRAAPTRSVQYQKSARVHLEYQALTPQHPPAGRTDRFCPARRGSGQEGLAAWQQRLLARTIEWYHWQPISLATPVSLIRLCPYRFGRDPQAIVRPRIATPIAGSSAPKTR
jgi:hypothetical protein